MQEAAAAVPLRAVREMQQEFIESQAAMTQQSPAVQQSALSQQKEILRVRHSLIAQLAPQFPAIPGRTDHFLPWILECQTCKEQRNLPDAVAIQYAIKAMGDTLRGIFPAGQTFPNWDEPVKELRPKFMPHTADWTLFVIFEQWKMRGD